MIGATIADASDVRHARVLGASFCRHHPGARFVVVRLDDTDTEDELHARALDGVDLPQLAAVHGPEGLRVALVPTVCAALAAEGTTVVLLDARQRVAGSLTDLDGEGLTLVAPGGEVQDGVLAWRAGPVADAVAAAWPAVCDGRALADVLAGLPLRVEGVRVRRTPLPVRDLRGLEEGAREAGRPSDALPAGAAPEDELRAHLRELAAQPPPGPRAWTHLREDLPYGPLLRAAFRNAGHLPSPFTAPGLERFLAHLRAPAPEGASAGVTRAVHHLWSSRDDLRAAYPQLDGPDGPGLVDWVAVHGSDVLPPALRPTPSAAVRDLLRAGWAGERTAPPFGVNVAGFLAGGLGLGEAGRLVVEALDAAEVPVAPVGARLAPAGVHHDGRLRTVDPDEAPFPLHLLCMTGEATVPFAREVGDDWFTGRHTIGLWFWELETPPPPSWAEGFARVDEVWATSAFVHDALLSVSPVPVVRLPLPVAVKPAPRRTRAELGLPEGRLFLYIYDLHSVEARKNPSGLARAFGEAFAPGSGNVLVLKSVHADRAPEAHARVLAAAGGHPDVYVIDGWVDAGDRDAMIELCDCYVSPHRSEGFGLTIAEAMARGRPVIATGYGGNADFTTPETAYVLPWTLRPVGPGAAPYPADACWADPDHDALVAALRHVAAHPEEALAVGERGREHVLRHHGPQVVGEAMRERLALLHRRMVNGGATALRPGRAAPLPAEAFHAGRPEPRELRATGAPARLRARTPVTGRWVEGALTTYDGRVGRRIEQAVRALDERARALVAEVDRRRGRDRAELEAELRRLRARVEALEGERPGRPGPR